jgi:hypothetical protein
MPKRRVRPPDYIARCSIWRGVPWNQETLDPTGIGRVQILAARDLLLPRLMSGGLGV